ncbi:MAG TPA: ATP-binding protein [Trebonia sp.]|nr:ATP-binding protein [Trebonia sp.]
MNAVFPGALAPLPVPVIPPHPQDPGSHWLTHFDRRDYLEVGAYDFAPATIRALMRERLPRWGLVHLLEAAELVASELSANAVAATRESAWDGGLPPIQVWLLGGAATVGVLVRDAVLRAPMRRPAEDDDESGRGLQIVEALSSEWGAYFPRHPFSGKLTWAFIRQP